MSSGWHKVRHLFTVFLVMFIILAPTAQPVAARAQVGLALGGGAARGISHIGLLKAFEEEGVPIDIIVGSSMGSIIAGLYASGLSIDNLTYMMENIDVTALFDPQFPLRGGLLDTEQFHCFLDELTGHADIATLPIPFYTVLTNLDTGEEYTLNHGSLSQAIRASMSMPVVYPPVEIDGAFYVDGGTKNLVPANVVRAAGADVVVAVDIKKEVPVPSHDDLLTNIRLFMQFMFRGYTEKKLPYADYLILPNVSTDSYMDYSAVSHFIEEGYVAAKAAMPQIKEIILQKDPNYTFTQSSPRPGVPAAEFAQRFRRALAIAYAPANGASLRISGLQLTGPEYTVSAVYTWQTKPALSAKYIFKNGVSPDTTFQAVEMGLGNERGNLFAAFGRRYATESCWYPGARLQLDITDTMHFEAEWLKQNSLPNEWMALWRTDLNPDPASVRGSFQLQTGQDPRGLYGDKRKSAYIEARPELLIPLTQKSIDVWEVATIYPSLILGGTVRQYLEDSAPEPFWRVQTGLATETRFFGIHAIKARFVLSYDHKGESSGWSLGIAFGK